MASSRKLQNSLGAFIHRGVGDVWYSWGGANWVTGMNTKCS